MSTPTKWFIIGSFALSTALAYTSGFAISSVAKRKLEGNTPSNIEKSSPEANASNTRVKPSQTRRIPQERNFVDPVVRRSIFDSTKANLTPTKTTVEGDGVSSALPLTLLATIIATPEQFSIALIQEDNTGMAMTYGVGYQLLGEATITKIEKERVYFKRVDSEELEFIDMGEDKSEGVVSKSPGSTGEGEESEDGIQKVSGNKYIVDQKVMDEILANPEQLYSQVRVTPHKDSNGEIDGYRMTGIRRQSVFYKLGVKNGDIVHSVNGQSLNSMSSAMDAYNSLANSRNFNFDITRRKNKETFEYEVR